MFKAIDTTTDQFVVSLEDRGEDWIAELRLKGHADALRCQTCREPVLLKAGEVLRPHFAHKTLANCPTRSESPDILEARAVLYEWLRSKFGDGVTLEKAIEGYDLPRPIDCWVEDGDRHFAYWLVERQIKLDTQMDIEVAAESAGAGASPIWVILSKMLRRVEADPETFKLSMTERRLTVESGLDAIYGWPRHNLHYLDADTKHLTTLRAVRCVHPPQVFSGREIRNPLASVLVGPQTGEFVHPGEYEKLKDHERQVQERQEQQRRLAQEAEERRRTQEEEWARIRAVPLEPSVICASPVLDQPETDAPLYENAEAVCVFCGQTTRDWWFYDGKGHCKCNDCQKKGRTG